LEWTLSIGTIYCTNPRNLSRVVDILVERLLFQMS
jgi:hypothetical protein